jgi:hypothetical protein
VLEVNRPIARCTGSKESPIPPMLKTPPLWFGKQRLSRSHPALPKQCSPSPLPRSAAGQQRVAGFADQRATGNSRTPSNGSRAQRTTDPVFVLSVVVKINSESKSLSLAPVVRAHFICALC